MKKLLDEQEYMVDITAIKEDNIVLLNAEHQLGCTEEIHDILVDFYNMGLQNSCVDEPEIFFTEGIVVEDVMELLYLMGWADKLHVILEGTHSMSLVFMPTMLYGVYGRELCQAVAQVIEANKTPAVKTVA
jgi:hypothetical protein